MANPAGKPPTPALALATRRGEKCGVTPVVRRPLFRATARFQALAGPPAARALGDPPARPPSREPHAQNRLAVKQALERFAGEWKAIHPDASRCAQKDFEALTAWLALPADERVSLRTADGTELLSKELKLRTKPMDTVVGGEAVYRILDFVATKIEMSRRKDPYRNSGFRKLKPFTGHSTHLTRRIPLGTP